MPAVNGVGEPCAGEPHARIEVAAGAIWCRVQHAETALAPPADPTGWNLRLAEAGGPQAVDDFSYVIEAIPHDLPLGVEVTEQLGSQVFLLLSLIAGQEIGVGPMVGVDATGRVVWGAPRFRPDQSAWRWCPRDQINQALSALATGLSSLADDPALQQVVDRAGRHLLAANGQEVLDVRIPVACSGLELLGWAVLQRQQWLTKEGLSRLPAKNRGRLLLQWAGIPVELPSQFGALAARRGRLGQSDVAGPELVFDVRNNLVHPPKPSTSRSGRTAMSFSKHGSWPRGTWNSPSFGCFATRVSTCHAFGWEVGTSTQNPCPGQ